MSSSLIERVEHLSAHGRWGRSTYPSRPRLEKPHIFSCRLAYDARCRNTDSPCLLAYMAVALFPLHVSVAFHVVGSPDICLLDLRSKITDAALRSVEANCPV